MRRIGSSALSAAAGVLIMIVFTGFQEITRKEQPADSSAHAVAETSKVTSPEPEIAKPVSVNPPGKEERLFVLTTALVVLGGFGVILEGLRRRSQKKSDRENAK